MNGTSSPPSAFSLQTPRLTFGGEATKIGTFEWVQNVTVDGKTMNATSQVTGVDAVQRTVRGKDFYGFAAVIGISYPYGQSIVQDPTISSQAVTDLAMGGERRTTVSGAPAARSDRCRSD